jgi:hypothetical protein
VPDKIAENSVFFTNAFILCPRNARSGLSETEGIAVNG